MQIPSIVSKWAEEAGCIILPEQRVIVDKNYNVPVNQEFIEEVTNILTMPIHKLVPYIPKTILTSKHGTLYTLDKYTTDAKDYALNRKFVNK